MNKSSYSNKKDSNSRYSSILLDLWPQAKHYCWSIDWIIPTSSVTRLGNLLDFGQVFKAFGNN